MGHEWCTQTTRLRRVTRQGQLDQRVRECEALRRGCLENRRGSDVTVGSNPTDSAEVGLSTGRKGHPGCRGAPSTFEGPAFGGWGRRTAGGLTWGYPLSDYRPGRCERKGQHPGPRQQPCGRRRGRLLHLRLKRREVHQRDAEPSAGHPQRDRCGHQDRDPGRAYDRAPGRGEGRCPGRDHCGGLERHGHPDRWQRLPHRLRRRHDGARGVQPQLDGGRRSPTRSSRRSGRMARSTCTSAEPPPSSRTFSATSGSDYPSSDGWREARTTMVRASRRAAVRVVRIRRSSPPRR